jgi:hypothetical protein
MISERMQEVCLDGPFSSCPAQSKRFRWRSVWIDTPLLGRSQLVFLAVADLDGLITLRLDCAILSKSLLNLCLFF